MIEVQRLCVDWIPLSQGRNQFPTLINTVMRYSGYTEEGKFLCQMRKYQLLKNDTAAQNLRLVLVNGA